MRYSLGFAFSTNLTKVVLIRKNKPAFMAGKWNGLGGKVEPEETPDQTMVREFKEESGLLIESWTHFNRLVGPSYSIDCYYAVREYQNILMTVSNTEELVSVISVPDVFSGRMTNLCPDVPWLVAQAMDHARRELTFSRLTEEIHYQTIR
jgi:8-oxo-dGTP diphosphatase